MGYIFFTVGVLFIHGFLIGVTTPIIERREKYMKRKRKFDSRRNTWIDEDLEDMKFTLEHSERKQKRKANENNWYKKWKKERGSERV